MADKDKTNEKVDQAASNAHRGVSDASETMKKGIHNASDQYERASRHAEEEMEKLKAELADLRRRAAPKIEEAEHFLVSPTAIAFYKGLVTGVAIVLAYQKYSNNRL
ncbi:hypothetical protein RMATCC62417_01830 [Rhizopus microsporus]|nr:hypothetical protein RMATCC62417_01830 [Rhizopus microsporus]CEI86935.1 hypothetical protein RMCBS344292_01358 [Rhizopus microsporus]